MKTWSQILLALILISSVVGNVISLVHYAHPCNSHEMNFVGVIITSVLISISFLCAGILSAKIEGHLRCGNEYDYLIF